MNYLTDEYMYEGEQEYSLELNSTKEELQTNIKKVISDNAKLFSFLGREKCVDIVISEINYYCKNNGIL